MDCVPRTVIVIAAGEWVRSGEGVVCWSVKALSPSP
ncbi:hypothetical protein DFJ67_8271 [Asanoa ferruginea]|uniref:Uncharacterized protein n=1 Tax=Asanoa ferruginea TaxID=53367 RepID=A0A3D9ZYD1_9ACTN|nr:hypothetical protein DFJ67_8271 [Asanoa ferruginea]